MPRDLMRRHEPRDSPSCTREFGPTEATMCAAPCASARTITQFFATWLAQRVAGRCLGGGDVGAAVREGGVTTGVAATIVGGDCCGTTRGAGCVATCGAAFGTTGSTTGAEAEGSGTAASDRSVPALLAVASRGGAVS